MNADRNINAVSIAMAVLLLIIFSFDCNANENISCAYPSAPSSIMREDDNCGIMTDDDLLIINDNIVEAINWSKYGLECVYVYGTDGKNGWYIVNQSGEGRITSFWSDNTCAPFSEGLVVGLSNGTIIYYNQIIEIAKRTEYVWASNFKGGYSKVCIGNLIKKYSVKKERHLYSGGQCGYIDRNFKVVVPLKYDFAETPSPPSKSH